MYERSAIVLERYFETIFGFSKENNLKTNYKNYIKIIEEIKQYQKTIEEEEKVIEKFDEVAQEIEEIQKKQSKLYESNLELENERNHLFNDLGENPNVLDNKLQKIEEKTDRNNEELKELREKYVKAIVIFTQRQKERNRYARIRRTAEAEHRSNIENAHKMFESISKNDVQKIKEFINLDNENIKQEIMNAMIKNGKNEKIPFYSTVIEKAVKSRLDIAKKEADLYISIYDRTKKILTELNNENIKLSRAEKLLRDVSVKLAFLNASKEYIVNFLDNERMTAINGKIVHEKLMKEACKNFEADMEQIDNLYELVLKEITGKSTKKAYKELYNKNYLKDIEEKEKNFEEEVTNIKVNMATVINSNYWRIEGIKNIYQIFQEEISEKFNKDLSEYKIEELTLPGVNEEDSTSDDEYDNYENDEEDNDEYDEYEDEEDDDEYDEYEDEEDDGEYDEYEDEEDDDEYDEYEDEEDDDEYDDYEDNQKEDSAEYNYNVDKQEKNENIEDDIDNIIKNSRKNINSKKNNKRKNGGILGKLFKK